MTKQTVAQIAAQAGAEMSEELVPNTVVAFCMRRDGGVTLTAANGAVYRTSASDRVHASIRKEHSLLSSEMVALLGKLVELSGGRIVTGVTYQRRRIEVAAGEFGEIFVEAGR